MELRGETAYRFTAHLSDRTTHENLAPDAARERLGALLTDYGQGLLQGAEADWQVLGETVLRRPPSRAVAPRAMIGGSSTCSRKGRRSRSSSSSV